MKSTTSKAKLIKYRGTYLHLGSKRQCQITEGGSENSLFKSFGSLEHNPDKKMEIFSTPATGTKLNRFFRIIVSFTSSSSQVVEKFSLLLGDNCISTTSLDAILTRYRKL